MLRSPRSLTLALAAASLALAPAAAHAASKKKTVYPTVSNISPRKLTVGQKLTITGAHFRPGVRKTTVVFLRKGAPSVFLKADSATSTKLVLTIPQTFQTFLTQANGAPVATQFHMRILAAKFAKTWTKNSRSPLIFPLGATPGAPGTPGAPSLAAVSLSCEQAAAADPTGDADHDALSNATELKYLLDPCNEDTDGDGAKDGYEYFSAIDLNGAAQPYPGNRPWPNPLDPSDIVNDFDGDGLTLGQESSLWKASGATLPITTYSDGTQNTNGVQPVTTLAQTYLDLDGDGNLTDDERDFDGDGLSNMVEFNYTGTQAWWRGIAWGYQPHGTSTTYTEPWYTLRQFSDPDPMTADTDGDGILDAADDQDADGWSNFVEMQLGRFRTGYRVHPFNPCLPDPHSRTCSRWVPLGGEPWPPFDKVSETAYSGMPGDAVPFGWPFQTYATWDHTVPVNAGTGQPVMTGPWNPSSGFFTGGWDGNGGPQGPLGL